MDKIFSDLSEWIKSIIKEAVKGAVRDILSEHDNADGFPEMMNRKECIKFLEVDASVFDKYRKLPNFPQEQVGTKWKKRAIKAWLSEKN